MIRRRRTLLLAITLGAFSLLVCSGLCLLVTVLGGAQRPRTAPIKNHIVYGLTVMPDGFDPHINSSTQMGIVLRSVYDTLVYRDPHSKVIVPGLASKWDVSSDGLTYTFHLKTGVKFHDGTTFDASAVGVNLDRIMNPDTHSQKAIFLLGPYDHYTVVDPQTIQLVLKSPYAPFLDALSQFYLGIASPKALTEYGNDRYQFHQVGTGPYEMVDYIPGDHVTLRRNPDYTWGPPFYIPAGPQSIDEVDFRFYTDPTTRAAALESGDANVMGDLSSSDATLFTGNNDIRLYPQAIPGEPLQFLFNTARAPTDNITVRQALIQATDRSAVVEAVFQDFSPIAYGPLSAVTPGYDPRLSQLLPYDSTAALNALGQAGYSDSNGDKILDNNGKNLHLVMVVAGSDYAPEAAAKIQSLWHDLGIELEIRQVPNIAGLNAAVQSGDYNLIAYEDDGVEPSIINPIYLSNGPLNWMHFVNPDLDNWLNQATTALDGTTRQNMYIAIQDYIMQEALILPIRDQVTINGATANVGNVSFDAYGWYPVLANMSVTDSANLQ